MTESQVSKEHADIQEVVAPSSLNITQLYLNKLGYTPLLTAKEEVHYARLSKKGDKKARDHLIKSNLRLVVKIAKKYRNKGLSFLDLIEEGNLGLMHAIEKFDPELGYRFSTYATWWIKQDIERALMNQSRTVRLPVHIEKLYYSLLKTSQKLSEKLRREPTPEEIAQESGRSIEEVQKVFRAAQHSVSMDAPLKDGSNQSLIDIVEDKKASDPANQISSTEIHQKMHEWVQEIEPKYRDILEHRFGIGSYDEPGTFEAIGKDLGFSRERVRQMLQKGLLQLRKKMLENGLTLDVLLGSTEQ